MEENTAFKPSAGNLDDPPNSRLFVVLSRTATEEQIRERFSAFGDIQDIWVVKDRHTKESKGIAFVKYPKSSQACRAMEEMHWKVLGDSPKPIKVFIAQSRSATNHRDVEDEQLTRLFVVIPKTYTEEDMREKFEVHGDVQYCSVIKNKTTGESKGFGYVKFLKPSQAALAIENCDKSFKAILAEPKRTATSAENDHYSRSESMGYEHEQGAGAYPSDPGEFCGYENMELRNQEAVSKRLAVVSCSPLVQEQLFILFDLIPGLEYCEVKHEPYSNYGHALVQYRNISSAVYAKYKLHGFAYPPGNRLGVSFVDDGSDRSDVLGKMATQVVAGHMASIAWNSPASQQYGAIYERGGFGSHPSQPVQLQTEVTLPSPKQKALPDSPVKERLFLVFQPHALSVEVLDDVFCRFGHLIEVYLVPGKNVGYAKFADEESAKEAMTALNGKVVNRVKLKVMPANFLRSHEPTKRQRTF